MFLHALQLATAINLKSVFDLSNIACLPIGAVNNSIMNGKIRAMP